MCVLISSTTFVWNISHSEKNRARYDKKIYIGLRENHSLFLLDFHETWIFSTNCWKGSKYQISWESVKWEPSCSMRTDGPTDITNLVVAFRKFAYAPTGEWVFSPRLLVIAVLLQFPSSRRWATRLFISQILQVLVSQHCGCDIEVRTETKRLGIYSFPSRGRNAHRPTFHVVRVTAFYLITLRMSYL
jgi:hypothetical protein